MKSYNFKVGSCWIYRADSIYDTVTLTDANLYINEEDLAIYEQKKFSFFSNNNLFYKSFGFFGSTIYLESFYKQENYVIIYDDTLVFNLIDYNVKLDDEF